MYMMNLPQQSCDGIEVLQTSVGCESKMDDQEVRGELKPGKKSRRARRGQKTFRPYYQLSEEERQRREEKEMRRVERLTQEMKAKGHMTAPYNTTQFLLSDHGDIDDNFDKILQSISDEQEEGAEYYSDEDDFMSKEFNKDYEQEQFNNLLMMNKERLLNEYLEVAKKNEFLEEKLEHLETEEEEMESMRKEMVLLKAQNIKLQRSNSTMKERIRKLSETGDPSHCMMQHEEMD